MYSIKVLIVSLIFFVGNQLTLIHAAEAIQCKGKTMPIDTALEQYVQQCLQESGAKTVQDIPADKAACFGKCLFAHEGLIDEKGIPHKERVKEVVDKAVPDEIKVEYIRRVGQCLDDFASKIDPAEENCSTYKPVMDCILKTYVEMCHS